jgi:hypothetical protein
MMKGRHVRPFGVGSEWACGCCAVFKGRREVRTRGFLAERGLSKLNSMHGLELHDLWHHAKAWWAIPLRISGWPGQVRSTY